MNGRAKDARQRAKEAIAALERNDCRTAADLLAEAQLAAENAAVEQECGEVPQ